MSDTEQSEKRKEPSGRPLTEEEWMELMNTCDRLSQYAKRRKRERRKKRREERKDESEDE